VRQKGSQSLTLHLHVVTITIEPKPTDHNSSPCPPSSSAFSLDDDEEKLPCFYDVIISVNTHNYLVLLPSVQAACLFFCLS
jgi:hypothetical protein